MSERLKLWLKDRLIGLVGVQQVALNPPASLVSRTYPVDLRALLWTGVIANIYVLQEALKPRAIKHIIQHDTGQGVASMFILAPHLVPSPRVRLNPPEWLMNLHALNNERLYTYAPEDREMALLQLHLERVDATELYEALYGPEVNMERLHYGRVMVRQRAVKGYWLAAHFGPAPFWQQARREFFMPPPRQDYAANGAKQSTTAPGSQMPRHEKTQLEISYEILGIHLTASEAEVKTAFRRQVFNVHPDVSALPKVVAEERFRVLAEAYEFIKMAHGWV